MVGVFKSSLERATTGCRDAALGASALGRPVSPREQARGRRGGGLGQSWRSCRETRLG